MENFQQPILDFQVIDTNDPRILIIEDTSRWSFIEDKVSIIEIIIPGRTAPIITYYDKNTRNFFHSLDLAVNCISGCGELEHVDLPDGSYSITLKGSPDTFCKKRNYFRTNTLRLRIDKLYLSITKFDNSRLTETLEKIDVYLKSINAHTKYNNIVQAQALYQEVEELVEMLENCKTCKDDVYTEYKT